MDEDGLPIVGSGVDLTKVPAIQQRRVVAYLNQFVVHTVRFLNRFSTVCEEKLSNISLRIQQIETTLCILEAKLSSIPGLEDVTIEGLSQRQPAQANGPTNTSQSQTDGPPAGTLPPTEPAQTAPDSAATPKAEAAAENVMTVAKDPRYARYLKMVQVGVPVMAIKNKMVLEGLDPSLLDTPDAPLPDGGTRSTEDQDIAATSSDSESSFSD
ncbi:WASH complex subunit 3 [Epinephelus lanceolatus]|uniref:WASH complex subunit 3 n=1 Tax=Epinephelus lanceolatus TaxID=310571 RepID=UPI001447B083|nr:WASH complex subunit 3 [Epinephelus lanceolatus]XP_033470805.1 WASH complex subunit 3 [Epinephelus lanceolatus]